MICLRSHGELPGYRYLGEVRDGMGDLYRASGDTRGERLYNVPSRPSAKQQTNRAAAKKTEEIERFLGGRRECAPGQQAARIAWYAGRLSWPTESSAALDEVWEASEYTAYPVNGEMVWRPKLDDPGYLLTPMRNGHGKKIGVAYRNAAGEKWRLEGGREGLFYSDSAANRNGPIVQSEGPTDAKAGIETGLAVVARPSVSVGAEYMAEWVRVNNIPADKPIIALIENDRKSMENLPSCETDIGTLRDDWPGRTGSRANASQTA